MSNATGEVLASQEVAFGTAAIRQAGDGARLLTLNNVPQSIVYVDDPARLGFDYARWISVVIDAIAPPGKPIRSLMLGGGAYTLPRFIAATRPGSRQVVVEADRPLTEFVARELPLPADADVELLVADALDALKGLPSGEFDLVINDVYQVTHLPSHLTGVDVAAEMARVLKPEGLYTLNVLDLEELRATRAQLAGLRTAFADTCLVCAHTELGTKEFINAVVAATNAEAGIPLADLKSASLERLVPVALMHGEIIDRFTASMTAQAPPE